MTQPPIDLEAYVRELYYIVGKLVFASHPDWIWLMENRDRIQKFLDAGKS